MMQIQSARSNRGMSLIAVLVAVAVLGIIAVLLTTLYENMTGLINKSNVAYDADKMARNVQKIMDQQASCKYAIRGPTTGWTGTTIVPLTSITYCVGSSCLTPQIVFPNQIVGSPTSPILVDQVLLGP